MTPISGGDVYRVPLTNIDINAANLADLDRKSAIVQRLVASGFQPAAVLKALDMPEIEHTGVPTSALQPVASINPIAPATVYDAGTRELNLNMPEQIFHVSTPNVRVDAPIVNVPETVVNVTMPEQRTVVRTVERDADGRILHITERVDD
jgi:hypothetical protein